MKDKCHNCGNDTFEEKLVTMTLEKENKLFKIKNVPAKVCTRCGQEYFSPATYEMVYNLVNDEKRKSEKIEAEQLEFA